MPTQRERGRRGVMGSVDMVSAARERRISEAIEIEEKRRRKAKAYAEEMVTKSTFTSSEKDTDSDSSEETATRTPFQKRSRRAIVNIISPGLAATLDMTGISSRRATFVLAEAAKSFGHDIRNMNINRMSIYRHRKQHRAQFVNECNAQFPSNVCLVVHWDGKLMEDITGNKHVDRLPVIVSGEGTSQLLGAPKVQRNLLYLPCRHHIMELLISTAFEKAVSGLCRGGPIVQLFKRLKEQWNVIDKIIFHAASTDVYVHSTIADIRDDIIAFARQQLNDKQLRDDYREFLHLSIIFIGEVPPNGVRFMAPGAMHHARWMSKWHNKEIVFASLVSVTRISVPSFF